MRKSFRFISACMAIALFFSANAQSAKAAVLPQTDAEFTFDSISFILEDGNDLVFEVETPTAETFTESVSYIAETPAENVSFIVEAPTAETVTAEAANLGNYGRLFISSVNVSVALYYTEDMTQLQTIVDREDSAAMFAWNDGNMLIADHSHQGFAAIGNCVAGTVAEIVTPDGSAEYTCKEIIYDGWNTGSCLAYNDFTPISVNYTGTLVMYTCNYDGTVTITIWG